MNNKELVDDLRDKGHRGYGGPSGAPMPWDLPKGKMMKPAAGLDKKVDLAADKAAKPPVAWGVLQYFPRALTELAKVSAYGCNKYSKTYAERAFLGSDYPIEGYDNAMVRHLLARFTEGPINRTDGGVLHRAQVAWCALAALEKELLVYEGAKSGVSIK